MNFSEFSSLRTKFQPCQIKWLRQFMTQIIQLLQLKLLKNAVRVLFTKNIYSEFAKLAVTYVAPKEDIFDTHSKEKNV